MASRKRIRTCCVAIAAASAVACGTTPGTQPSPSGSTTAPTATDGSTIAICHRSEAGSFARTVIPTAGTATHLAHGDAFPGHFVPGNINSRFDQNCVATAVVTATITFSSLTSNGAPVATIEELGFQIKSVFGPWEELTTYGAPAPSVIFRRPASTMDGTGTIEVRSSGGLFAFSAVDLYSSVTPIPYTVIGYLGKTETLVMNGIVPNTFGKFARVTNTNVPQMVDSVSIYLVNPATPCCGNPVGLDNIVLRR